MKASYIAFDTETGGLDPKVNPVLTVYFCALNENLDVIDDLYVQIKPDSPYDKIDAGAMAVNKIDIAKHIEDPNSLARIDAKAKIEEFLKKNGPNSVKSRSRPKPLGHNLNFDIGMIREQLVSSEVWEANLHYHLVDTMPIAQVLKDSGWLPSDTGNLASLVRFFNIEQREAHHAKGDVLMTVDAYKKMLEMLKNNRPGSNSAPTFDLLSMLEK